MSDNKVLKQHLEKPLHEQWDSCIEVVDWRRRVWRFNYKKYASSQGWCIDWEILTPNGSVKTAKNKDVKLAERCLNKLGLIDQVLLEYEVNWFVVHYTNTINIKSLKASQES